MATTAANECGDENETADHITTDYPLYSSPHDTDGLIRIDDDTASWLQETYPDIGGEAQTTEPTNEL